MTDRVFSHVTRAREYEDLDEYEEEGEEQEEEKEEEEEETRQPTQEELEYLGMRQRLKESIRKQMKKDSGSSLANSREKKNKLPYDNYGSFFGPSQPVIAQRVIQESRSLLENPHLAAKVSKPNHLKNKGVAPTPGGSRPRVDDRPQKVTNGLKSKSKVQILKDTRDYSFLLSDDAEVPVPTKGPPPRSVSARSSANYVRRGNLYRFVCDVEEARSAQVPPRSKPSLNNNGRKVVNGRDERRPLPTGNQIRPKVGPQTSASTSNRTSTSVESRKQLGSSNGSGPGRPLGPKGLPSKVPNTVIKRIAAPIGKSSINGLRQPAPSKLQSSNTKPPLEQKKRFPEFSNGRTVSKRPVPSSKPQVYYLFSVLHIKQPPVKTSANVQDHRPKKRPVRQYSDDEEDDGVEAISMIRNMFGYNPRKYRDDDDDSDMEANFDDIMMEERRSAKIARREDEEELRKTEEEERRERLRKKRKLGR
ncbi:hypothetical protein RJ639_026409 [Escallonia herrerae]|uniref:SPT2 chromatin protein n=1 Tax=Escallonia herrerae TaxID=1293975 RepID=A0AA88UXE3_9ASTE|nr:hypothetical protein RJ639_026409 [Escallonia herrerae]